MARSISTPSWMGCSKGGDTHGINNGGSDGASYYEPKKIHEPARLK